MNLLDQEPPNHRTLFLDPPSATLSDLFLILLRINVAEVAYAAEVAQLE